MRCDQRVVGVGGVGDGRGVSIIEGGYDIVVSKDLVIKRSNFTVELVCDMGFSN